MSTLFDELTDAELAYVNSGGRAGLPAGGDEPQPNPAAPASPPASTDQPPATQAQQPAESGDDVGDDDGEEVVIVGKDGRPRAKNGKFVPHAALHKERETHKATKAELADMREKMARGEERLAILNEAFASNGKPAAATVAEQKQPENPYDEETIDPNADFIGAFKQLQRRNEYTVKRQNEVQQVQTSRDTFQKVTQIYHDDARKFMSEEPNFEGAYRHLLASRHKELAAMGMTDETKRNAYIAQEETALVIQSLQAGQSPARVIYTYAQSRGFTPNAAQGSQQQPSAAKTPAQQKIEQVRNGQHAAQSLSNGSGTSAEGLTYSQLSSMSDAEFAAAVDGMSKAQVRALLGG